MKFPHATEQIQWGNDLVFKIGGKMFAVAALEASTNALAFKCAPEEFALLTENEGIVPAPYLARAHWVSLQKFDILSGTELAGRLRASYDLVLSGLPKRLQTELAGSPAPEHKQQKARAKRKVTERRGKPSRSL